MSKYKTHVELVSINYRYSFANQGHKVANNNNKVQEYIFVGYCPKYRQQYSRNF